ncbi:hypothetical protein GV819_17885 [Pseudomonas sp. Fl5BN2]|uniref:hypothetical protein n=1 Tax=Pseudomonas sp. Fl5BN2 TaxID=2697652 RepID=UPI0013784514|nr:hypothetical protein [Pseudomonas sp. Fl5BN2]NBF04157.1 hypothetical protein [Pseudomonas sp. Fl5BN2]
MIACASLCCSNLALAMDLWVRDTDSVKPVEDARGSGIEIHIDSSVELARYLLEHYGVMSITQLRRGTDFPVKPVLACCCTAGLQRSGSSPACT